LILEKLVKNTNGNKEQRNMFKSFFFFLIVLLELLFNLFFLFFNCCFFSLDLDNSNIMQLPKRFLLFTFLFLF